MQTQTHSQSQTQTQSGSAQPSPEAIRKAIGKRSFATLATSSAAGRPHTAGVLFELVDNVLYVNTMRSSRKALNVAANTNVAVCIPVRRLPVGPPSSVHFQGRAEILDLDHPQITALISAGRLKSLTSHGELDEPDGCFLRIALGARLLTYGLGMSLRKLIGDPLHAGGSVDLDISS